MNAIFPSAPSSYTWKSRFAFSRSHFVFFSTVTFFISLHSDLLLLLCLCCRQCCCCISLSSLILHRSWFLYIFFYWKRFLHAKLNSADRECSIQARFSFFFFSLSLLIHRRRRMCNLELLHFSRVIWAPLRLLRVVVLRKKQAISNFFCCMMSSSPKTLLFLGANLIVKNESFLRIIIMRRNFPKHRNFMEYVYTRLRNVKKFQGIINFSL